MVFNYSVVYVHIVTLVSHLRTLHILWHVLNTCNIMFPHPRSSWLSYATVLSHAFKSLTRISYLHVGMNCSREQHISYQLMGPCISVEGKISIEVSILYRMGKDVLKYRVKLPKFFFLIQLLNYCSVTISSGMLEEMNVYYPYHMHSYLPKCFLLYVSGESLHHLHHQSL
jgi:hypothetical protein